MVLIHEHHRPGVSASDEDSGSHTGASGTKTKKVSVQRQRLHTFFCWEAAVFENLATNYMKKFRGTGNNGFIGVSFSTGACAHIDKPEGPCTDTATSPDDTAPPKAVE